MIADLWPDYEQATEAWMEEHSKGFATLKGRQAFFERKQGERENAEVAKVLGIE